MFFSLSAALNLLWTFFKASLIKLLKYAESNVKRACWKISQLQLATFHIIIKHILNRIISNFVLHISKIGLKERCREKNHISRWMACDNAEKKIQFCFLSSEKSFSFIFIQCYYYMCIHSQSHHPRFSNKITWCSTI